MTPLSCTTSALLGISHCYAFLIVSFCVLTSLCTGTTRIHTFAVKMNETSLVIPLRHIGSPHLLSSYNTNLTSSLDLTPIPHEFLLTSHTFHLHTRILPTLVASYTHITIHTFMHTLLLFTHFRHHHTYTYNAFSLHTHFSIPTQHTIIYTHTHMHMCTHHMKITLHLLHLYTHTLHTHAQTHTSHWLATIHTYT